MNPWWLLLIVPASAYAGYVFSNWQWRRFIQKVAAGRPTPDPYR